MHRHMFASLLFSILLGTSPPEVSAVQQVQGTISGQVSDVTSGQPLAAVQVFIPVLSLGSVTGQNGSFQLLSVPAGTHELRVERLGYSAMSQQITVTANEVTTVNFQLQRAALQLDEVLVTGTPGGTQRRAIGNAITRLDATELTRNVAVTDMQNMLTGRTPGLQFSRVAGSVGTGSAISIRGPGSINLSSNPLIIVDGVRVNNSARSGPAIGNAGSVQADERGSGAVNVLNDFNPADIESIEVIKGPAAATLYGTEASAGVIQIITKRGATGAPQFELSTRQGANFMVDPAGKIGPQYACRQKVRPCPEGDIFSFNGYEEVGRYIRGEVLAPNGEIFVPGWPTDDVFSYGHTQSYDLSVRGGTDAIRYFVSANRDKETGIVRYNWDEAYRLRANLNIILSDSWTFDLQSGYVDGSTRFGDAARNKGGPFRDVKLMNGRCLFREPLDTCALGGFYEIPIHKMQDIETTREYSRFTGGMTLTNTLGEGDWFTQRAVIGIDKSWDRNEVYWPRDEDGPVYAQTTIGEIEIGVPTQENLSLEYSATARYRPNVTWQFSTAAGIQYYIDSFESVNNLGRDFASPLSRSINQTAPDQWFVDYQFIQNKSVGLYIQEEVSWNDRLFVTGAVRFDDNSAFGTAFDAQIYPKLSATWVVSEEPFWNVGVLNSFRARGAWGKAGRQPSAFAGANVFRVIAGPGGSSAIMPSQPGNPNVAPEVSTELELGFDASLLNDRFSGEFTYFTQRTDGALLNQALAPSMGFPGSSSQNLGRIDNWGWEAVLNVRAYEGSRMGLDLRFSGDHQNNEIKDLGSFPGNAAIRVGLPYPNLRTNHWIVSAEYGAGGELIVMCDAGVRQGSDDLPRSQRGVLPGGEIVPCRDAPPSLTQGILLGPTFFTHRWTVAPTMRLMNNSLQIFALAEGNYGKWGNDSLTEWQHRNCLQVACHRIGDDPLYHAGGVVPNRFRDQRIDTFNDQSFWKLREIGARVDLPQSLVARTGADRASIAVSGRDLAILWRRVDNLYGAPIADPELGSVGGTGVSNFWETPPTSSVHVTLRVTF